MVLANALLRRLKPVSMQADRFRLASGPGIVLRQT